MTFWGNSTRMTSLMRVRVVQSVPSWATRQLPPSTKSIREVRRNAEHFRKGLAAAGFTLVPGEHPIIPVMIGDAAQAGRLAAELQRRGIYVTAFSYPVVPHGKARIRTQMNAAHSLADLDRAIAAFADAGKAIGLIG